MAFFCVWVGCKKNYYGGGCGNKNFSQCVKIARGKYFMILYFSATGNSKFVAEKIANSIGDKAFSIEDSLGEIFIKKGEYLGFVTPTYFLQLPTVVKEFFERTKFTVEFGAYTFLVATCGTSAGFLAEQTRRIFLKKRILLLASFSVKMCDTWTPIFDLSDKIKVQKINERAKIKIEKITQEILTRKKGNKTNFRFPYFIHIFVDKVFEKARSTKNFFTEDSCIACGLCKENCPVKAIEIQDGHPVWKKNSCAICLRCLHHCPKFAIQYGSGKTKTHGQYKSFVI